MGEERKTYAESCVECEHYEKCEYEYPCNECSNSGIEG